MLHVKKDSMVVKIRRIVISLISKGRLVEIGRLIDTVLCISITREEEIFISLVGKNNFS